MPFTPSHLAAALPFVRTPLIPAAVAIGTVAPDLPYFAPLGIPRGLTHSLVGAVTVDPLIGVIALGAWWLVVRDPVVDFLPLRIRERIPARAPMPRTARAGMRFALLVLVSLLIGIATHIGWDWFTHPDGLASVSSAWRVRIGSIELYRWLQQASSVAGLVIVAVWSVRWWRRALPDERPTRLVPRARAAGWIAVLAVMGAAVVIVQVIGSAAGSAPLAPALLFRTAVVAIGLGLLVATVICALWWARGRGERLPVR